MKIAFKLIALLLITTFFLSGCKKDSGTSLLTLRLHANMDTTAIVAGTAYHNKLGRNISFSHIAYYISNVQLTASDGTLVPVSGTILVSGTATDYNLGSIPVNTYKSISFYIGISTGNHDDPSTHTGADPLAAQQPPMHFSADSLGYIFMAVEGLVDSSAAGTGTPARAFAYHIGTDAHLQTVTLGDHSISPYTVFTASAQKIMVIDMIADFGVLTKNVDMSLNPITNTSDYPGVADSLANNIPSMFRYSQ